MERLVLREGFFVQLMPVTTGFFLASFRFCKGIVERLSEDCVTGAGEFGDMVNGDDIIITDTMGYTRSTVFGFLENHPGFYPVEKYPLQRGFYCAFCGVQAVQNKEAWKKHPDILPDYLCLSSAQTKVKELSS